MLLLQITPLRRSRVDMSRSNLFALALTFCLGSALSQETNAQGGDDGCTVTDFDINENGTSYVEWSDGSYTWSWEGTSWLNRDGETGEIWVSENPFEPNPVPQPKPEPEPEPEPGPDDETTDSEDSSSSRDETVSMELEMLEWLLDEGCSFDEAVSLLDEIRRDTRKKSRTPFGRPNPSKVKKPVFGPHILSF